MVTVTTHYNRHGEAVKSSYELGDLPTAGKTVGAFFVFGLLGLRDSAYSMMATPYVIFRTATGSGVGILFLLAVVVLTVGVSPSGKVLRHVGDRLPWSPGR